jgi:hypothetical protein
MLTNYDISVQLDACSGFFYFNLLSILIGMEAWL